MGASRIHAFMRAQYKGHRILDTDAGAFAIDAWNPRDPRDFSVTIDFYAGPEGDNSADAFTATVCSPNWFLRSQGGKVFAAESVIFMPRFDHVQLEKFLRDRCAATEGETWQAIGAQLTRLGRWEFDYRL
ncbi:MAG: hypothetical protein E5Y83_06585 [Mesorhizobium sp.]|nr:MAG: hypothetical protein E5Y83_06585 [Mesorhizobium sp.]